MRSLLVLLAVLVIAPAASAGSTETTLSRITGTTVICAPGEIKVGGSGTNQDDNASGTYWDGQIVLSAPACKNIAATLAGDYTQLGLKDAAWHTLAHEYAHHLGYDHGETTIGADCVGERLERKLMARAGIPAKWRVAVQRFVVYAC